MTDLMAIKIANAKAKAEAELAERIAKIQNTESKVRGRNDDSPVNSANKRLAEFAASGFVEKVSNSVKRSDIGNDIEKVIRRTLAAAVVNIYHVQPDRLNQVKFPGSVSDSALDDLDV